MYFQHAESIWEQFPELRAGVLFATGVNTGNAADLAPYFATATARLVAGWWQYHPRDVALAALSLANAGGAAGRWRVCGESGCREIGAGPAAGFDLIIRPCRPDK